MSNQEQTPLAHTILDACKRIGVSRSTIYELIHARELKAFKIGGRALIAESELQRIVTERMAVAI